MTAQPGLFDLLPPSNRTATSRAAAVAVWPRVGTDKRRILDLMADEYAVSRQFDGVGWTQDEVSALLDLPRSTVCGRMNALENEGWIKKNGDTRLTRYRRPSAVYVLAPSPGASSS